MKRVRLISTMDGHRGEEWILERKADGLVLLDESDKELIFIPAAEAESRVHYPGFLGAGNTLIINGGEGEGSFSFRPDLHTVDRLRRIITEVQEDNPASVGEHYRTQGGRDVLVGTILLVGGIVLTGLSFIYSKDGSMVVCTGLLGVGLFKLIQGLSFTSRASRYPVSSRDAEDDEEYDDELDEDDRPGQREKRSGRSRKGKSRRRRDGDDYDDDYEEVEPPLRGRRRPGSDPAMWVLGCFGALVATGMLAVLFWIVGVALFARPGNPPVAVQPAQPPVGPKNQPVNPQVQIPQNNDKFTRILGSGGDPFIDAAPNEGLLVGFHIGLGPFAGVQLVDTVQPIFRTPKGEIEGQRHGPEFTQKITVKAKPGYAVGAVWVKPGLLVNGLSMVYMREKNNRLDVNDTYDSEWIGDQTGGGPPVLLAGDGRPVIGIIGKKTDRRCSGIGLMLK